MERIHDIRKLKKDKKKKEFTHPTLRLCDLIKLLQEKFLGALYMERNACQVQADKCWNLLLKHYSN